MPVSSLACYQSNIKWLSLATILLCVPVKSLAACAQFSRSTPQFEQHLWQDLLALSDPGMEGRKAGSKGADKARQYIVKRFQGAGLEKLQQGEYPRTWFHKFKLQRFMGDAEGINVVAKVTGTESPEKLIVVTAHYDHLGKIRGDTYQGANDNASGVAAMLTLADEVAKVPLAHTVLFVATDYEEAGLYGARAFVQQSVVPLQNIVVNLNLDMFGQPGKRWTLYVAGTKQQPQYRPLVDKIAQSYGFCMVAGRDKPTRSYDRKMRIDWKKASDHYEFHKAGIPWLFIGVDDYKYYHTPADKPEKLSRPFFTAATEATLRLLYEIDAFHSGTSLKKSE